ncbi:hypothetical protein C8R46DRAFT_1220541 [Mycena filopes]|nr:hypothetical protein C8R46DRAFT_1220541 [Mycena filopes]
MASVALHVQELCDQVVDFLHGSQADIQSCALVSPVFTAAAQRYLFRDINLVRHARGCDRLFTILSAAPHLLAFVRRVHTHPEPDVLTRLGESDFPNLTEFLLVGAGKLSPTRSEVSLAANLVGLPSIRSVTLKAVVFQTISDLNLLFDTNTSQLDALILDRSDVLDAETVPSPPLRRVKINKLRIHEEWPTWPWFFHPRCPFDISGLCELEYDTRDLFFAPATLLTSARLSLTTLSISPRAYKTSGTSPLCMAVADLPALTHLRVIRLHGLALTRLAPLLQSDSITLLTLVYSRDNFGPAYARLVELSNLRANISARAFPRLQTVEVNVPAGYLGQVRSPHELQTEVRAALTGWDMEEKLRVVVRRASCLTF